MNYNIYSNISTLSSLLKKMRDNQRADEFCDDAGAIKTFLKLLKTGKAILYFEHNDHAKNKEKLTNFLRAFSDKISKDSLKKEGRFFKKIKRKEDIKSLIDKYFSIAILDDKDNHYTDFYRKNHNILVLNQNNVVEKWKKLKVINLKSKFTISQKSEIQKFKWEMLSDFREPSSSIEIFDRYIFKYIRLWEFNLVKIIEAFIPRDKKAQNKFKVVITGGYNDEKSKIELNLLMREGLTKLKKYFEERSIDISLSCAGIHHNQFHSRYLFSDMFSLHSSTGFGDLFLKENILKMQDQDHDIQVFGYGNPESFNDEVVLRKKFKEYLIEADKLNMVIK